MLFFVEMNKDYVFASSLFGELYIPGAVSWMVTSFLRFSFFFFQLKILDGEKEQRSREVAELQTRLTLEEQREEERMKEAFILKQKLTEAETARDSLRKEVKV